MHGAPAGALPRLDGAAAPSPRILIPAAAEETCDGRSAGAPFERTAVPRKAGAECGGAGGAKPSTLNLTNAQGEAAATASCQNGKSTAGRLFLPRVPIGCIVISEVFKDRLPDCLRTHIRIVVRIEAVSERVTI